MDAHRFGCFLADIRKEQGMTQAELAEKTHVTDKAVSRWERGIGFPDINTLEPLAAALQISVLELMRSERTPEDSVSKEDASAAVVESMQVATNLWYRVFKRAAAVLCILLAIVCLWMVCTGLCTRSDVFLLDYTVLEGTNDAITLRVGIASSMGYTRSCANISKDPTQVCLRFYSAFGGLNSSLGAQNTFLIIAEAECTEIYFETSGSPRLVLQKNPQTGQWELVT